MRRLRGPSTAPPAWLVTFDPADWQYPTLVEAFDAWRHARRNFAELHPASDLGDCVDRILGERAERRRAFLSFSPAGLNGDLVS